MGVRVASASNGRLTLTNTCDRGRCLQVAGEVAAGEVLAVERPVAMGSSDGQCLIAVCQGMGAATLLDASEDLLAACALLHADTTSKLEEVHQVANEMLAEAQASSISPQFQALNIQLHSMFTPTLQEAVSLETLGKWRALCDSHAESWAEVASSRKGIMFIRFRYGLFGALAMAEHSCRPNARVEWDSVRQVMQLVAVRPLQKGEFVSRSYLDAGLLLHSKDIRQQALKEDWGFVCACTRCSANKLEPEAALAAAAAPLVPGGQGDLQKCAEGIDTCV